MNQGQLSIMQGSNVLPGAPTGHDFYMHGGQNMSASQAELAAGKVEQTALNMDYNSLFSNVAANSILHCITPLAMQMHNDYAKTANACMSSPCGVDQVATLGSTKNAIRGSCVQAPDNSFGLRVAGDANLCPINLLQEMDNIRRLASLQNDVSAISQEFSRRVPLSFRAEDVCAQRQGNLPVHFDLTHNAPDGKIAVSRHCQVQQASKRRHQESVFPLQDTISHGKRRRISIAGGPKQLGRDDGVPSIQEVRFFNEGVEVNDFGRPL